jgi:hypothetical protein
VRNRATHVSSLPLRAVAESVVVAPRGAANTARVVLKRRTAAETVSDAANFVGRIIQLDGLG